MAVAAAVAAVVVVLLVLVVASVRYQLAGGRGQFDGEFKGFCVAFRGSEHICLWLKIAPAITCLLYTSNCPLRKRGSNKFDDVSRILPPTICCLPPG